jgi:hypothetical protein
MAASETLQISSWSSVHPHAKALCEVVDNIINDIELDHFTLLKDHALRCFHADIA